jgi:hypothetical protein
MAAACAMAAWRVRMMWRMKMWPIYGSVPDLIQKKDPPSEDGESIK